LAPCRRDRKYVSDDRSAMQKINSYRSATAWRAASAISEGAPLVGSLLLGLYDGKGLLQWAGKSDVPLVDVR
jgi:hypothetical protein